MGTFCSFLPKKKKKKKMDNIFLPNKKEHYNKNKCGLPTGFNNGHPLDRKRKFSLGWPGHAKNLSEVPVCKASFIWVVPNWPLRRARYTCTGLSYLRHFLARSGKYSYALFNLSLVGLRSAKTGNRLTASVAQTRVGTGNKLPSHNLYSARDLIIGRRCTKH